MINIILNNNIKFNEPIFELYGLIFIKRVIILIEEDSVLLNEEDMQQFYFNMIEKITKFTKLIKTLNVKYKKKDDTDNNNANNLNKKELKPNFGPDLKKMDSFSIEKDEESVEMNKMLMILTYEILLLSFKFKQSLDIFKDGNLLVTLSESIKQIIKLYINNALYKNNNKTSVFNKKGGGNSIGIGGYSKENIFLKDSEFYFFFKFYCYIVNKLSYSEN